MTVEIRFAGPADAAELARLAAVTFPLACPPSLSEAAIAEFIALNLSREKFATYLADESRILLLAESDAEAAGYAMLVTGDPSDPAVAAAVSARPTIELSKFYVLEGHHGRGVAATLMAGTIGAAAGTGAASCWLGVNQQNARANRFYEKHGFLQVGTRTFQVGPSLENDFVRELPLP
jgi:ribosomal protein S18 acetylase RimI-like enzyme